MILKLRFILLYITFIGVNINLYGQACPTAMFSIPASACLEEVIEIENTSMDGEYYEWDFCVGEDFQGLPTVNNVLTSSHFGPGYDVEVVQTAGKYYGFVTTGTKNNLIRLDFGDTIGLTPQYTNLGNFSGGLIDPASISIIEKDGSWYGLVTGSSGNKLYRLDFGTSLTNVPVLTDITGSLALSIPRSVDIFKDGNNYVAFVVSFGSNKIVRLNFGTSPANAYTADNITIALNGSELTDMTFTKNCNLWYGFLVSRAGSVNRLDFGDSLLNSPTETIITNAAGITLSLPTGITMLRDGDQYTAFITSRGNSLYRLDFGADITANPSGVDLGNVNGNNRDWGITSVKVGSKWNLLGMNFTIGELFRYRYTFECKASISTSNEFEPADLYFNEPGTYELSLTVQDLNHNESHQTRTITINNSYAPDIDFSSQNICISSPVNFFSENTSGNITSYSWDFGDTNSSTDVNPSHTYASAGEYAVTLSVTSSDGCENLIQKSITIYDEPIPDFDLPSGIICTNNSYVFQNTTPGDYDGNISYEWFVNGLPVATTEDLNYEFSSGGAKEIKLVASIPGCSAEVIQNIANVNEGAIAEFNVNDDCVGKALQFNNTSTGDIVSTHWDFGNGFTSNLENPLFQYAASGTYDVTLTLTNSAGCVTSKVQQVNVFELPDVLFTNELACEGTPTAFTDETTVGDANIASWQWNFDDPNSDENISLERNPTHIFTTSGSFDVKLVAQSTNGCRDSLQRVVNVKAAPIADFSYDKLCINEVVQFSDLSEPVSGEEITAWSWDLGGVFSAEQNPETTFQFPIDYNVGLTVTSENLCSSTIYKTVTVTPAPEITFGVEQACDNADVHFFDTTDPLGDPITSRSWNFSDLGAGVDSSTYFAFNQAGNYDVGLTIMTENGCDYSKSEQVQIYEAPTAAFEPSATFGAPPLEIEFDNQSIDATSYEWIFGDGDSSNEEDPVHIFTEEDAYKVELIASDANGCNDTTYHQINVLFPDLDLVLVALNRSPNDETQFILTVGNNGTVAIDGFKAIIDLGNQAVIEKIVDEPISPRTSSEAQMPTVNINLGFNINPGDLDYLCITTTALFEGLADSNGANNTKCISLNDKETLILAPYPNPAGKEINLRIIAKNQDPASVQLFDTKGDLVKNIEMDALSTGMNNLLIDVSDVRKGMYVLKVSSSGTNAMYKLVIGN